MKVAFVCCVFLLAGSAIASPVEAKSISLPEWIPEEISTWIQEQLDNLPDSIQTIIDRLPEIIAAVPEILENIKEVIEGIIAQVPEIIASIIDRLPEIIAQIPALAQQIREILLAIIEQIPELIANILDKIPEIIEAFPEALESIKAVLERIKEILEELELPDWLPSLPDLELPEWWPTEIPTLPEYNRATPGVVTDVNEYPSIVQIEVGTASVWVQGCAGSIVTNLHILTAARCFSGERYNPRFRRVRAGSSTRLGGGEIVSVERAVNHPEFSADNLFNADIAVVRLATALVLSATVQQTAIVTQGYAVPVGIEVTQVGWGSTAQGKLISDRNLYQIDLASIDKDTCADRWSLVPLFSITDDMICIGEAQYGGRNGDVRDMGAPIYLQGILVGVESFGAPIGNQYFPVIATNVGSYTNWVISNAV